MNEQQQRLFHYHGLSMWPCFQEGDLLEITQVDWTKIKIGDCLVFWGEKGQQVVHRVSGKSKNLKTRGDAFRQSDESVVLSQQIIGRVIYRHRWGRKTSVANGLIGHFAGRLLHFAGRIDPQRPSRGGRLARSIQRLSLLVLKPLWERGKIHTLQRDGKAPVIVWRVGSLTIGCQDPTTREWTVSWPWRIMVKLPLGSEQKRS